MTKFKQIIIAKTAWSEDYQGSPIYGRHQPVQKTRDGNEKFNFLPGPDGRFYVYLPPTGGHHTIPALANDWTILVVAAETHDNGRNFGPLKVVGWLENATFVENRARPEYQYDNNFDRNAAGHEYIYNVIAEKAFLVPVDLRKKGLPDKYGRKLGSASKVIVRAPTLNNPDQWRLSYSDFAEGFIKEHSKDFPTAEETAENNGTKNYATQEHKRRVEKAAEKLAKKHFKKTHHIEDVTKENRGYDFHLTSMADKTEILLEVKGTASPKRVFFLTRNEHRTMEEEGNFKILLASGVLTDEPKIDLFEPAEIMEKFNFEPMSYHVSEKSSNTE